MGQAMRRSQPLEHGGRPGEGVQVYDPEGEGVRVRSPSSLLAALCLHDCERRGFGERNMHESDSDGDVDGGLARNLNSSLSTKEVAPPEEGPAASNSRLAGKSAEQVAQARKEREAVQGKKLRGARPRGVGVMTRARRKTRTRRPARR